MRLAAARRCGGRTRKDSGMKVGSAKPDSNQKIVPADGGEPDERPVVLIAMDDEIEHRLIAAMLWIEGYRSLSMAEVLDSGDRSLAARLAAIIVDLADQSVLLDELRESVRRLTARDLPVVGLSSQDSKWSPRPSMADYAALTRPYTPLGLSAALRRAIAQKSS